MDTNGDLNKLLLRDLAARLPYGVKVKYAIPTLLVCVRNDRNGIKVITESTYSEHIYNIEDIKPYLRPMSSMTKKEQEAYMLLYNEEQSQLLDSAFAAYNGNAFVAIKNSNCIYECSISIFKKYK